MLALEAGGEPYPENVTNPALWYTLFGTPIDWGYLSVPQKALGGRPTYEPRGKMPGGSSNLYIMMHIRGHASDYDNWAYNGCPGWSYDECLAFFQKLEDQEDDTNPTAGKGGPIHVSNAGLHDPNPTSQAFLDACAELGFPSTDDFNGPNMEGAGWHHINVKDGKRYSTQGGLPRAGVLPREPDLSTALAGDAADPRGRPLRRRRVRQGRRAAARRARRREVIVCAGAIESPHLLLCLRHRRAAEPAAVRDRREVELPGVGENFHNHVLTGVIREGKQQVPTGKQNLSEVALFCKSDPALAGARPADRVRARAVRHHRRADAPERDQHPARRRAAALARLRPPLERRPARQAAREPELPRGEGRPRPARPGRQARARDLRDAGVLGLGRRGAAAGPRRRQLRRRPERVRDAARPTRTTTRPAPARWASTSSPSSIPSCASTASRACGSPTRA